MELVSARQTRSAVDSAISSTVERSRDDARLAPISSSVSYSATLLTKSTGPDGPATEEASASAGIMRCVPSLNRIRRKLESGGERLGSRTLSAQRFAAPLQLLGRL